MKERQLIGMVQYVEWIKFQPPSKDYILKDYQTPVHEKYGMLCQYANFLSQPLELSMFVPCDEDGNPLEEPTTEIMNEFDGGFSTNEEQNQLDDLIQEYQAAKERVIFEGTTIIHRKGVDYDYYKVLMNGGVVYLSWKKSKKVKDLIQRNVTLTESTYNKYFK